MSRPARWECESCRRLLGEIEGAQLRLARSVEVVYVIPGGVAASCPRCETPRLWQIEPSAVTSAPTS